MSVSPLGYLALSLESPETFSMTRVPSFAVIQQLLWLDAFFSPIKDKIILNWQEQKLYQDYNGPAYVIPEEPFLYNIPTVGVVLCNNFWIGRYLKELGVVDRK